MEKLSLKDRLYRYLLKQHGYVSSGDLQKLVMEHTTILPRTTVRRLQEMVEEGKLQVDYRKKHHAFYKAIPSKSPEDIEREMITYFNSLPA